MGSFNYVEFLCCSMEGYCWFSILITDLCLSWSRSGYMNIFHFDIQFVSLVSFLSYSYLDFFLL